ncbi:hypothetical protein Pfo_008419, partial [Paulownia fortunei]
MTRKGFDESMPACRYSFPPNSNSKLHHNPPPVASSLAGRSSFVRVLFKHLTPEKCHLKRKIHFRIKKNKSQRAV